MAIDAVTSVGTVAGAVAGGVSSQAAAVAVPMPTVAGSIADSSHRQVAATETDLRAALRAAAKQIDSYLKSVGREVEFRVDEDTDLTVVTVRNTATGEVVRQIPSEEALQLARHLEGGSSALLSLTV